MSFNKRFICIFLFLVFTLILFNRCQSVSQIRNDSQWASQLPEETLSKIELAVPNKAVVKPAQSRKLLVFNLNIRDGKERNGHPSIPYANYAIELMGKMTGAFEVVFSNDTMMFHPDKIKEFDAICFNNTVGVLCEDPILRYGLLDYVYEGGGFIGIHAAGATFVQYPVYDQFPEFGVMLGGYENGGHPWKPHEWITLKVDEPNHPINYVFEGNGFDISDEVFQFTTPYTRDKLRVLLTIDTQKTDMSEERYILPERRADEDLAISWVREYGRGRVFYTTLGHNPHINWDPNIMEHYLAGIQYALGDLDVPDIASNKATAGVRAQETLGWKLALQCWTMNRYSFEETCERANQLGFSYLETYPGQILQTGNEERFIHTMSVNQRREVRKLLEKYGLRVINYGVVSLPNDEAECRQVFDFAKAMGIETIVSEPPVDAFPLLNKLCKEYDIQVAVHNHPEPSHYWHPDSVLVATQSSGPHIGACIDTGHWMRSGVDPIKALDKLKDRVVSVHLKDVGTLGERRAEDVILGSGKAKVNQILKVLAERNFKGVFSLEYESNMEDNFQDVKQCVDYFDKVSLDLVTSDKK